MKAAYSLIPVTWIPVSETWQVILIGLALGLLAVLYRDVRRFARYFRGKDDRMTHPLTGTGVMTAAVVVISRQEL